MSEIYSTWGDGSTKWYKPTTGITPTGPATASYETFSLIINSCDIKSDVVGQSWSINRNNIVYLNYQNGSISEWSVTGNIMTLFFNDSPPLNIKFWSPTDAKLGEFRLFLIMNGKSIIGCNDASLYGCDFITDLNITFS